MPSSSASWKSSSLPTRPKWTKGSPIRQRRFPPRRRRGLAPTVKPPATTPTVTATPVKKPATTPAAKPATSDAARLALVKKVEVPASEQRKPGRLRLWLSSVGSQALSRSAGPAENGRRQMAEEQPGKLRTGIFSAAPISTRASRASLRSLSTIITRIAPAERGPRTA